jgi:hypothetical protein
VGPHLRGGHLGGVSSNRLIVSLISFPVHALLIVEERLREQETEGLQMPEGDLRTVQEALGHADPKTTAIYSKVGPASYKRP